MDRSVPASASLSPLLRIGSISPLYCMHQGTEGRKKKARGTKTKESSTTQGAQSSPCSTVKLRLELEGAWLCVRQTRQFQTWS